MTLFEAQDHLEQEIGSRLPDVWLQDNLVNKPGSFPCVVIEPDGSRLMEHGGGCGYTGEQDFMIWVICAFSGTFRQSREAMLEILDSMLDIPRFYANERVEYGDDVIWDKRVVVAKLSGRVA